MDRPVIPPHRTITAAPALTALAHPTRLALIEAIGLSGSLTATEASTVVGESPTACAYHLRTLAKLGFIEEAGGGHGRQRPWRLAQSGMSFDDSDDDPDVARAAAALGAALTERFIARIRSAQLSNSRQPRAVQDVSGHLQSIVFGTPAEVDALRSEIFALMGRFTERIDPAKRPPGSYPFELVMFTHVLDVVRNERKEPTDAAVDTDS